MNGQIKTFIGYFYLKRKDEYKTFLCSKTIGISISLAFVIIFFYTYTGIIGTNFAILDVGSFFVGVLFGEYVAYKLTIKIRGCKKNLAILTLVLLFVCFIVFTYNAPQIRIFKEPIFIK